jgi:hypothetical protein
VLVKDMFEMIDHTAFYLANKAEHVIEEKIYVAQ